MADAGIPLGSQSVLLKGINDNAHIIQALMRRLIAVGVRPYDLHHPDPVAGTAHFRVPRQRGMQIMQALRGHISGMWVPRYRLGLPGGGGKVPLLPHDWRRKSERWIEVMNDEGRLFRYRDA